LENPPPDDLPASLREPYERNLKQWVGEHPFTAQPLFMDYAYAWLFTREDADPNLSAAVRTYLCQSKERRPPYRPTPLLATFAADLAAGSTGQPTVQVSAENLGFVYESVLSGASAKLHPKLTLISSEDASEILGELTTGIPDQQHSAGWRMPIRLSDDGNGLWFWRRLSYADIQISTPIRIGARDTDFVLGPDINIEAASFACESPTVRVVAPTREMSVLLVAETYTGDLVEFSGTHDERKHLGVSWIPRQQPWAHYSMDVEPEVPVGPEIREAFRKLRRILVCFRAEGYGEMARHEDLLNNEAIAGSDQGRAILKYCVSQRLIRSEGPIYVLDRDELNRLEINWPDIRERRLSQAVARFLKSFVEGT